DGLHQRVHPGLRVPLPVTDLRDLAGAHLPARVEEIIAEQASAPFDLAAGPMMRALAIRRRDTRTTVVLVVHHIVWDGWSAEVFEREWTHNYRELLAGRTPSHPDLPVQYADYARSEQSASVEEHVAYWTAR